MAQLPKLDVLIIHRSRFIEINPKNTVFIHFNGVLFSSKFNRHGFLNSCSIQHGNIVNTMPHIAPSAMNIHHGRLDTGIISPVLKTGLVLCFSASLTNFKFGADPKHTINYARP